MNSLMTRRATASSIASSAGISNGDAGPPRRPRAGRAHRSVPVGARGPLALGPEADRARPRDRRRDIEAGLGLRVGRLVGLQAGALRDDPRQLADVELGPLVAQERQGDPLAPDVARARSPPCTGPRRRAGR